MDSLTELNRQIYVKAQQFDKVLEIQKKEADADQKAFIAEVKNQNLYIVLISTFVGLIGVGGALGFLWNNWQRIKKFSEEEAQKAVNRQRDEVEKQVGEELRTLVDEQKSFIETLLNQARIEERCKAETTVLIIDFTGTGETLTAALIKMGFRTEKLQLVNAQDELPEKLPRYDLLLLNNEGKDPDEKLYQTFDTCLQRQTAGSKPMYFYFGTGRFEPAKPENKVSHYPKGEEVRQNFANSRSVLHARLIELLTVKEYFS